MNDIIERIRGAIYDHRTDPRRPITTSDEMARAILRAIREPTEAMLLVAADADNGDDHRLGRLAGKEVWQAMVDEALK